MRQEDDAAFWNRLVPVDERPEGEDAAELGVRAARLRAVDEVRHGTVCVYIQRPRTHKVKRKI